MQGQAVQPQPRPFQQPGAATATLVQNDLIAELRDLVGFLASSSAHKFNTIEQFMEKASSKFLALEVGQRNTQAILKDIQTQLGSVAQAVAQRAPGTLPGHTIPNLKDPNTHYNAITTRSGKVIADPLVLARQAGERPASAFSVVEEEMEKEFEVLAPKPQPVVKEYIPQLPLFGCTKTGETPKHNTNLRPSVIADRECSKVASSIINPGSRSTAYSVIIYYLAN
ncbi:unnamed protein product [Linum trigynum]|uniref:Uncharacterized protein n=1 Tax=Linum trigynum TaxID=586398 RepID=A0AAV2EBI6_9ROSI